MLNKYRKALPSLLIGVTLVIIGLANNENLTALGAGMLAVGIMLVWQAENPRSVNSSPES